MVQRLARMVSIHAPARGRTWRGILTQLAALVSIHAPARGRTAPFPRVFQPLAPFQSTPPRGGEPKPRSLYVCAMIVSIHAPARGRTGQIYTCVNPNMFQSTPPRGGEPAIPPASCFAVTSFNPRPRAGANVWTRPEGNLLEGFNPRPRAGANSAHSQ